MSVNTDYKKIVFIDDDKKLVEAYKPILKEKKLLEYLVYFDNALDGIDYLKKNAPDNLPDYVLLDLYMPDMNGFEFLQNIDQIKTLKKSLEIYVCTSSRAKEDRNRVMKYPFVSAYLEKPLPADFIELLIQDF